METIAFFEKKVNLTPKDLNKLKTSTIEELVLEKAKKSIENKCSEQGFVLPGSVTLLSRSMGYFEAARFTGDAVYYAKLQGQVIYPADGVKVVGQVIRKNKMGLYVNYRDAIRIQVPRDLHLGNEDYEAVQIGNMVEVEIKRSKFQINDDFILASGLFLSNQSNSGTVTNTNSVNKANIIEGDGEGEVKKEQEQEENILNTGEEEEFEEEEEQAENEVDIINPQMGGDNDSDNNSDNSSSDEESDENEDEESDFDSEEDDENED